jgi:hypothetical protein
VGVVGVGVEGVGEEVLVGAVVEECVTKKVGVVAQSIWHGFMGQKKTGDFFSIHTGRLFNVLRVLTE